MDVDEYEEIGFLKYDGKDVPKGIIDAASAGSALIGLDEAIRFFNERQSPNLAKLEYQIPVKIEGGSWVALVLGALTLGSAAFALSYAKKAGEKLAENDIGEKTTGEIVKKSFETIQSLIKLVKHTRKNKDWNTESVKWEDNNELIGIPNDKNEYIYIPYDHFKRIAQAPQKILVRVTEVVTAERSMSIGVKRDDSYEVVKVNSDEKRLFSGKELEIEDEEFLLPELEHGNAIKLEGKLTRGNAPANSVGFEYQGHIINCIPEEGSIVQYKPALFLKCIVEGTITRLTKKRVVAERRPTIILKRVTPLESDSQNHLF